MLRRARAALLRLAGLVRRDDDESRVAEEMSFHLDRLAERFVAQGLDPAEARRRARLEFGGVSQQQEHARDALRSRLVEDAARDLRHGWRSLRRHPVFGITSVLTAGLGIAAVVTVFSILDAIYLRPLPVARAGDLVSVGFVRAGGRADAWLAADARSVLAARTSSVFDAVVGHSSREVLYVTAGGPGSERFGAFVTAGYFDALGIRPWRGRFFLASEDSAWGRDPVVVISHELWRTFLGADPDAIGRTLTVRGHDVTIVGIAPPGFAGITVGGAPDDLWLPTMMFGIMGEMRPGTTRADVLARLRPGITIGDAARAVGPLSPALSQITFGNDSSRLVVRPARGMAGNQRADLTSFAPLLLAIAVLLAVVVCANLTALLVTRGLGRSAEIALRRSLGAGTRRLVRQLMAENLIIGLAGGALGLALSVACVRVLMGFFVTDSEAFPRYFRLGLDARVIAFAVGASLVAVLLFGLIPAILTSRAGAMRQGQAASRVIHGRGRLALTAAQVALTVVLLVGAGLLARSFAGLLHAQSFDPSHVALLRLRPQMIRYDGPRAQRFLHAAVRSLAAVPGVTDVAFVRGRGFVWGAGPETVAGGVSANDTLAEVHARPVSPGFLHAMRIPLIGGREFTEADDTLAPLVAVVTESIAHKFWPDGNALDRNITLDGRSFHVVGVCADFVPHSLAEPTAAMVLVPYWQNVLGPEVDARVAVRLRGDPVAALPALRRAVNAADPDVPVTELLSLEQQIASDYTPVRLGAAVLESAAGVALFLSALGLYGVISSLAARRTRELGLRLAVGATPGAIARMILRQGALSAGAGALAGLVVARIASTLLSAWLLNVPSRDPAVFAIAASLAIVVALGAAWLPARNAARLDPMTALRAD